MGKSHAPPGSNEPSGVALSGRPYGVERVRFLPKRVGDSGQERKGASDCSLCGGTMRIIADITDPDIIQKILDHIEAQPPPNKPVTAIQS